MASTMQLEFSQAMSDFKTMFPEMDRDVIEAVLRANQGAVDATIDQLLAMSTDNQNERLRNELEKTGDISSLPRAVSAETGNDGQSSLLDTTTITNTINTTNTNTATATTTIINESKNQLFSIATNLSTTGASPKIKKTTSTTTATATATDNITSQQCTPTKNENQKKWNPPLLGPLPPGFLRLSNIDSNRTDFDLPDEQFALMLQNEEFMNELRWNQEFMNALEKEHQEKGRTEDDAAAFKERLLKHMGKVSRKKFSQMARVFTWQRNKKANSARHPDSLPLKEEPSDDEDLVLKK